MSEQDFGRFYEVTKDRVFQAVLVTGRNPGRAEDAVAEAFAQAFEHWAQVRQAANPTGWVVRTALNRYNSDWRIWRREAREPPDGVARADEHPLDRELVTALWRLPRRQRQAVALRVVLDLSEAETAQLLGIAPKTVSVHLHRGLEALRAALRPEHLEAQPWAL